MKITFKLIFLTLMFFAAYKSYSTDEPVNFSNKNHEKRYYSLIEEVRCLVCQNQSLSDSNAPLAQDLRNEIFKMIESEKSNNQILEFLVERYGDFVLYRPPLKGNTILLWFGPFILLLIALTAALFIIRNQSKNNSDDN